MHLPDTALHACGSPTVMVGGSQQTTQASKRDRGCLQHLGISWGLKGFSPSLVWQPPGLFLCPIFLCTHVEESRSLVQFHLISAMAGRGMRHEECDGAG